MLKNYIPLFLAFAMFAVLLDLPEAPPINIFLFIAFSFIFTFIVGHLLEKIKIPWIFAALLLGTMLAVYNPFDSITSTETFSFLAQIGMYLLLFIIGFEIDLRQMKKHSLQVHCASASLQPCCKMETTIMSPIIRKAAV